MEKSEKKKELIRSIKFLLFSISAGLIQMGSFALFKELLGWSNWLSYLLALVLSVFSWPILSAGTAILSRPSIWSSTLSQNFSISAFSSSAIRSTRTIWRRKSAAGNDRKAKAVCFGMPLFLIRNSFLCPPVYGIL